MAACLDVCPTGALFRTGFGTVVIQEDICNGCGYCVSACPYGVIDRREGDGRAWKCTMCYDRQRGGLEPACAKACPTDSIQFGPLDELRERAEGRAERRPPTRNTLSSLSDSASAPRTARASSSAANGRPTARTSTYHRRTADRPTKPPPLPRTLTGR